MDFECQSEKGGDPASGPPPSLPAGELLKGGAHDVEYDDKYGDYVNISLVKIN